MLFSWKFYDESQFISMSMHVDVYIDRKCCVRFWLGFSLINEISVSATI